MRRVIYVCVWEKERCSGVGLLVVQYQNHQLFSVHDFLGTPLLMFLVHTLEVPPLNPPFSVHVVNGPDLSMQRGGHIYSLEFPMADHHLRSRTPSTPSSQQRNEEEGKQIKQFTVSHYVLSVSIWFRSAVRVCECVCVCECECLYV